MEENIVATSRKLFGLSKGLHIEAQGCIVNIYEGLFDRLGRQVTAIEILPDVFADEEWEVDGSCYVRLIKKEKEDVKKGSDGKKESSKENQKGSGFEQ